MVVLNISQVSNETRDENKASSIGNLGEIYFDSRNDRIKAFNPNIITDLSSLVIYCNELKGEQSVHNASRITSRVVIDETLLHSGESLECKINDLNSEDVNLIVEASIPLSGDLSGKNVTYLGYTSPDRMDSLEIQNAQNDFIQKSASADFLPYDKSLERIINGNYTVETLDNPTERDILEIVRLYSSTYNDYLFELNYENVSDMLTGDNFVAIARDLDDKIVSISIAEVADIELNSNGVRVPFKFSEISDAATLEDYRGEGLYTAVAHKLQKKLFENDFDLVFGEVRALNYGICKAVNKLGRNHKGTLYNHCRLYATRDINSDSIYESVQVFSLNSDNLRELYR